jgi:signal peptidase I
MIATVAALAVRLFLVEDYRISSDSMSPVLEDGDLVFVNKLAYNIRLPFSTYEVVKFRRPRPSVVVTFTLPDRPLETFVKRVVAVEGDKVEMRNGHVVVNGVELHYEADPAHPDRSFEQGAGARYSIQRETAPQPYGPVDVPRGYFFALGDNRPSSIDSRAWGPVPYSCLKGRVSLVWLSLDANASLRKERRALWVN